MGLFLIEQFLNFLYEIHFHFYQGWHRGFSIAGLFNLQVFGTKPGVNQFEKNLQICPKYRFLLFSLAVFQ